MIFLQWIKFDILTLITLIICWLFSLMIQGLLLCNSLLDYFNVKQEGFLQFQTLTSTIRLNDEGGRMDV